MEILQISLVMKTNHTRHHSRKEEVSDQVTNLTSWNVLLPYTVHMI